MAEEVGVAPHPSWGQSHAHMAQMAPIALNSRPDIYNANRATPAPGPSPGAVAKTYNCKNNS